MGDIYLLLGIFLIGWYFWYLRKVAEMARVHAVRYCKQQGLQFISIARQSAKPSFGKREGIYIKSCFEFEFSGDGESSAIGIIHLNGLRLNHIDLPAYKI
ncbi:DUF3301 domain-containing protein [Thalassotalea sp. M1531]|uniref:DUF3301 domain-containing protein n=1 Tax=Thalassotalea algicola TaxID=2716224 RepID=A0A7Y0Q8U2_9GAMM|nr:DUF3301 domain-containing protein [Thalassotalea algicola]NMP33272.1 DUF3301 domain-containing protein [Thalassotalea algicola]